MDIAPQMHPPPPPHPRVAVFQKLLRSLAQSSQNKTGDLYGLWSEWQKLFYIEKRTVGLITKTELNNIQN